MDFWHVLAGSSDFSLMTGEQRNIVAAVCDIVLFFACHGSGPEATTLGVIRLPAMHCCADGQLHGHDWRTGPVPSTGMGS